MLHNFFPGFYVYVHDLNIYCLNSDILNQKYLPRSITNAYDYSVL